MTFKKLKDCIETVIDHRGKTPKKMGGDWVASGIPAISAKNVKNGRLKSLDQIRYVSEEVYRKWMKEDIKAGDCFLVSEGATLGERLYWENDYPIVLSQRLYAIRANQSILYPKYLYAYMNSSSFQSEIVGRATGSSVPGIRQTELLELSIFCPSKKIQKDIGDIYYGLSKRVEVNEQMNEKLKNISRALYKSWFVDFDPVYAKKIALDGGLSKKEAEVYAIAIISGNFCLEELRNTPEEVSLRIKKKLDSMSDENKEKLTYIASLFPSELKESKIGEIPKDFGITNVEEVLELVYGKSLKKSDRIEGSVPVYGSGGKTGMHNTPHVCGPGIIVGRKGTVGSLYWENEDFFPIDTTFYVKPINGYSLSFLYYLLETLSLNKMNTDAAVPGLNRNNVYRLKIPNIPKKIRDAFNVIANNIQNKISLNIRLNSKLEDMRDILLPKLLEEEKGKL